MSMSRFERISIVVGVTTAIVATATFLFSTGRSYILSMQSEQRDWAKSNIIGIFEKNETLSFEELFSEFTTTGVDQGRRDISRRSLRRSLLGLMETDVVAYNEDNDYFLKREAFFKSDAEEKKRQKEVILGATEALSLVNEETTSGEAAVFVIEDHILHIVQVSNGRFTKDELAGQLSRYFEDSGFGFRDYARHISKMLEVNMLHEGSERKIFNYPQTELAVFGAAVNAATENPTSFPASSGEAEIQNDANQSEEITK